MQKIPHPEEDADLSSVYLQVLEDNVENVPLPDYTDPTAEVNHFRIIVLSSLIVTEPPKFNRIFPQFRKFLFIIAHVMLLKKCA